MATASEIAYVRQLINEPDDSNGWTDVRIAEFIDNADTTRLAAADIYGVKASSYEKLVDISESGSSRKMSDLLKNALLLQKALREGEDDGEIVDPLANRPRTRAIVRP
jgi:hypothetical protein